MIPVNVSRETRAASSTRDAEKHCHEAIRINSDYHNAHKNLGEAYKGQGRYIEAAESYITAARKSRGDSRAHDLLMDMLAEYPEVLYQIKGLEEHIIRNLEKWVSEERAARGLH